MHGLQHLPHFLPQILLWQPNQLGIIVCAPRTRSFREDDVYDQPHHIFHRNLALRHVCQRFVSHLLHIRILDVVRLPRLALDRGLEVPLVDVKVVDAYVTIEKLGWTGEYVYDSLRNSTVCRRVEWRLAVLVNPRLLVTNVDPETGVFQAYESRVSSGDIV